MTTNTPIFRIAELEIDSDLLERYKTLLVEEIEASVATEPGVLMLHAVAEKDAPTRIRIIEAYADRDAYEAHLRTPHFLRYKAQTAGMVRSLRLVDVDPIMLASKSEPAV